MNGWPVARLGDFIHVKHGHAFRGEHFASDGEEVVLTPGNFKAGGGLQFRPGKEKYYSGEYPPEFRLVPGQLLVVMTDLKQDAPILGSAARVPPTPRTLHNQRLGLVTVTNPSQVDERFLYHLLNDDSSRRQLRATATGTTVRHTAPKRIYEVKFALPTIDEQRNVASVLDSIDDLIENNRRRIEVLEEMAQAIYREWFVHFRFPGQEDATFVDSPLGPIPEGWEVRSLFDVADVGFGFAFKSKHFADEGRHPVIRIRDVPKGVTVTFSDEHVDDRYRVDDGDVLIGMDGDFHLRQWTGGLAYLNQRVTRLRPLGGLAARHLLLAIAGPISDLNRSITGTTVAHLGKRHLERIQVTVPSAELLERSRQLFEDIALQESMLFHANQELAAMRDLLLPKLVSGEIDVSDLDLDAVLEGAV